MAPELAVALIPGRGAPMLTGVPLSAFQLFLRVGLWH